MGKPETFGKQTDKPTYIIGFVICGILKKNPIHYKLIIIGGLPVQGNHYREVQVVSSEILEKTGVPGEKYLPSTI